MPRRVTGAARASATLRKPASEYTPFALHDWPERELRQEYTRLRDIAVKRLKRMGQDPEARETAEYEYYSRRVPRLRDMPNRLEIERALANVSLFVRNPEISTVGGIHERKRREREAFTASTGIEEPAGGEYGGDIGEWFGYLHNQGVLQAYDSEAVVQYYYEVSADRRLLNAELFRTWYYDQEKWRDIVSQGPDSGGDIFDDLF